MTRNNVIQLFPAKEADPESPSTSAVPQKKQPKGASKISSNQESPISAVLRLDLGVKHPVTGIKYGGYMPLRCIVFAPELFLVLNPGQFKLLAYLSFLKWRYPDRPGCVRAALPYLSRGVGISRSTAHEYLLNLESLGLVECVETNQKLGNVYRISEITLWSETQNSQQEPRIKSQQSEIRTTTIQSSDCSSPKSESHQSKNQTEDLSSVSSISLSQHSGFQARWKSLPKKVVNKEREAIGSLLDKNPDDIDEIYKALVELETTGVDLNGEPCHSPIGLLLSSWNRIKKFRTEKRVIYNSNIPEISRENERKDEEFKQTVRLFLDNLSSSDLEHFHKTVEIEIRKSRPNIGEIRTDSCIFQSFLESAVANHLGLEIPETN